MPQIDFAVAVIIAACALALGFLIAFLIQNSKISALKNENTNLKTEKEKFFAETEENRKNREKLLFEISEKEREIAVRETILKAESFRAEEAERIPNFPKKFPNFPKD